MRRSDVKDLTRWPIHLNPIPEQRLERASASKQSDTSQSKRREKAERQKQKTKQRPARRRQPIPWGLVLFASLIGALLVAVPMLYFLLQRPPDVKTAKASIFVFIVVWLYVLVMTTL